MVEPVKFTVGGTVQAGQGTYLERPADDELFHACRAGEFAYILACRQIGKSSLMHETATRLEKKNVKTARVDLSAIGTVENADRWYFTLVSDLAEKLHLDLDIERWWNELPQLSSSTNRFLQFLQKVVLVRITEFVVIFIDEIDVTLGLDFTDDFFAAIRSVYNDRAQNEAYRRLTFVLLGVATPNELILDNTRTPFNIGQEIALRDFTPQESRRFREAIEAKYPQMGSHYFEQIYRWTSGHPHMTQKLCRAVLEASAENQPDLVDTLVETLFLDPEVRVETNPAFVQGKIINNTEAQEMLRIYKNVLENEDPVFDNEKSTAINGLKLYGLVVAKNQQLVVRNKLYRRIFDKDWIEETLRKSTGLGLPQKYRIVQEIGHGGFSTVYLAQQTTSDSEQTNSVAVKVLNPRGSSEPTRDKLIRRFEREARATANLDHPNIIKILDTGRSETGHADEKTLFIVMEYIPGGSLRKKLDDDPITKNDALEIVRQVGNALAYAHEHGMIHRDVNPNNILLNEVRDSTPDTNGVETRAVLTDFGLVKIISENHHSHTFTDSPVGTYRYMAPEQWQQQPSTPATDIYALAITFFEMLTGQYPFEGGNAFDIRDKHLHDPLPLLSEVAPHLGSYFDDILRKAAAKKPEERFQTIAGFINALSGANYQAEKAEQVARQKRAKRLVELAQEYKRQDPEEALRMIGTALRDHPGHVDALRLRGEILFRKKEYQKALQVYEQAFEQDHSPVSKAGLEYLKTLDNVAAVCWGNEEFSEAVKHYETIRQILAEHQTENVTLQGIWRRTRARLIDHYLRQADLTYHDGNPDNLEAAARTLSGAIEHLAAFQAEDKIAELQLKKRSLQIKLYRQVVETEAAVAQKTDPAVDEIRLEDETALLQPYQAIDRAYQSLGELEPDNEQWRGERRAYLKQQAEIRKRLANRAENRLEPDYEVAIRHYKCILGIEETDYPNLGQDLTLDLQHQIRVLQKKADHEGKYQEIRKLIDAQDYPTALEYLHQYFRQDDYEYRDVARLLWGAIYAKKNNDKLPPEWESHAGFETIQQRLVNLEREHLKHLKDKLFPWSQGKILGAIDEARGLLREFEEQVEGAEKMVSHALAIGIAEQPKVEQCRQELEEVSAQIESQKDAYYALAVAETAQKVEGWLQKIDDLESLLAGDNPVKDIPTFINQSNEVLQAIVQEQTYEMLEGLAQIDAGIDQMLNRVKLRIRRRMFWVVIDEVGDRDEALVNTRTDATETKQALAEKETELQSARQEATTAATELARAQQQFAELQKTRHSGQRRLRHLEGQKHIIPFVVLFAIAVGGMIGPRIANIPGLSTFRIIAFIILATYFLYYIWIYYLSRSLKK